MFDLEHLKIDLSKMDVFIDKKLDKKLDKFISAVTFSSFMVSSYVYVFWIIAQFHKLTASIMPIELKAFCFKTKFQFLLYVSGVKFDVGV